MLSVALGERADSRLVVLALGSHCDDIEIGCGGTILRLASAYAGLEVVWVVLAAHGPRADEARRSADAFLASVEQRTILLGGFRDSFFPYQGAEVKEFFEELKRDVDPDVVFTHHREDLHQDHRLAAELTWNTFRDHLILEYEIPKYDGDFGSPNFFVHLGEEVCRSKVELLMAHFPSQHGRGWFAEDVFTALLRLRGVEANSPTRFAEAFYCRKIVL